MINNLEIIEKEGKSLIDNRKGFKEFVKKEEFDKEKQPFNINFPKILNVKGNVKADVTFPEIQRIVGEVIAKVIFPKIQEITGKVTVDFPEFQRIIGEVKADVLFPEYQKIKGKVDVDFPEFQKIVGEVVAKVTFPEFQKVLTDIPVGNGPEPSKSKADPSRYVPVRLTNGRMFYDIMSQTINSNGRLVEAMERLITFQNDTFTSVLHGAKSSIGGTALQLSVNSVPLKRGVEVKAANANTANVYVGVIPNVTANTNDATDGFELGAGESMLIKVDNLNKIYLISSGTNQKVFWLMV